MWNRRCIRRTFTASVMALVVCHTAVAQSPWSGKSRAEVEAAHEQAFQEVLRDPGNLDNSFRYAQLAIELLDFEGAISALERMLILEPDLPRVRLELGALYFGLGSFAIARSYLESAVAGKEVPEEVRKRVTEYLQLIDQQLSRHKTSGSVTVGSRYQSNANSGPNSTLIRLFNATLDALPASATEQADFNAFLALSISDSYDLETQEETSLESQILLFGSSQLEQDQLDVVFADLSSGPRFRLPEEFWGGGGTVRPFVRTTGVYVDDTFLSYSYGAGLELTKQLTNKFGVTLNYDVENKHFNDNDSAPTASDGNGAEHEVALNFLWSFTGRVNGNGKLRYLEQNARSRIQANKLFGAVGGFSVNYEAPIGNSVHRWLSSFSVEYAHTEYDGRDPTIDTLTSRRDKRTDLRFNTNMPITQRFSVAVSVSHTDMASTLPNFEFNNNAVSISGTYTF